MSKVSFLKNEIFEIELPSGAYGYIKTLINDEFGVLLRIYSGSYEHRIPLEAFIDKELDTKCIAYVNKYSLDGVVSSLGILKKNDEYNDNYPKMFVGTRIHGYRIIDNGKVKGKYSKAKSYSELIDEGYIHKVLWDVRHIIKVIDEDGELVWPGEV